MLSPLNLQSRLSSEGLSYGVQWVSRKEEETLLLMLERDAKPSASVKPTRDALRNLSGFWGNELSCEREEDDGEDRGDAALPHEMDLSTLGLGLCG